MFHIAAMVLLGLVAGEQCDDNGAKTVEEMGACIGAIDEHDFRTDKRAAFTRACMESPRGFSDAQIVAVVGAFAYSEDKTGVLAEMEGKALGINCTQAVPILDAYVYADDKKTVLRDSILPLLTDVESNSAALVAAFTYAGDKTWAAALLATATNRNCVYGRITAKRVIFLVDVSKSMAATFTRDGTTWTRLSYVAQQLENVVREELVAAQSFNIYHFSGGSPTAWSPRLLPWSPAALSSATEFIETWVPNMRPPYGTDIGDALGAAYASANDNDALAVYLLTDGFPSVGPSAESIVASARNRTIPTHTVAFLEGRDPCDNVTASKELMLAIAAATGGTYRAME